jgi:dTMP kinase
MTVHGRFVTVEGIDGAGKSTQIEVLSDWLRARGRDVLVSREPGGTPLGETVRALVLHERMGAVAETLLMFAARAEHLQAAIRPALQAGRWVICDRFTDATYAYQCGGRGVPEAQVAALERWVHDGFQPDLTFLFDAPPEVAAARRAQARPSDRFESEPLAFFRRVREMYLRRARQHADRVVVIDATLPEAQVAAAVRVACEARLA